MDGENNGNPYFLMDDLGVSLFLETPIYTKMIDLLILSLISLIVSIATILQMCSLVNAMNGARPMLGHGYCYRRMLCICSVLCLVACSLS